jgi:hypothetical protein
LHHQPQVQQVQAVQGPLQQQYKGVLLVQVQAAGRQPGPSGHQQRLRRYRQVTLSEKEGDRQRSQCMALHRSAGHHQVHLQWQTNLPSSLLNIRLTAQLLWLRLLPLLASVMQMLCMPQLSSKGGMVERNLQALVLPLMVLHNRWVRHSQWMLPLMVLHSKASPQMLKDQEEGVSNPLNKHQQQASQVHNRHSLLVSLACTHCRNKARQAVVHYLLLPLAWLRLSTSPRSLWMI